MNGQFVLIVTMHVQESQNAAESKVSGLDTEILRLQQQVHAAEASHHQPHSVLASAFFCTKFYLGLSLLAYAVCEDGLQAKEMEHICLCRHRLLLQPMRCKHRRRSTCI